ncbi:xylose isomerase [Rhodobacterales bacterium HTCC2255]|nr:xylose isomerase [Rhodobacterales bacterium HTCC2255]
MKLVEPMRSDTLVYADLLDHQIRIIMSGHMVMRNVLVSCMLIMKHKKELLKHFKKLFLEINKRIGVTRKLNVAL